MHSGSTDRIGSSFVVTTVAACALGAGLSLAGCSAPRTWPSVSGDQGISADAPPLPQVVVTALKHAHQEVAPGSALIYNLPEEINVAAFATYERELAPGKPMCPGDTSVWTVRRARIDGSRAQVELEYPARDGIYQTLTVHLQGASAGFGYRADYLQYWKVPVRDPMCQTPVPVVERLCGADAAARLKAERDARRGTAPAAPAAPAASGAPTAPAATSGDAEPSK